MSGSDDAQEGSDEPSVEEFQADDELKRLLSTLSAAEEAIWRNRPPGQSVWQAVDWFSAPYLGGRFPDGGAAANKVGSLRDVAQWKRLMVRSAKQAADRGDRDAAVFVAWHELVGHLDVFLALYRDKAAGGDKGSLLLLPGLLAGTEPVEAEYWTQRGGTLGRAFWRSTRDRTPKQAAFIIFGRKNFLIAAQNGFPFAMERAGDAGIATGNQEQALNWYRRAAEEGRAGAMFGLFELLWARDREESLDWLQRSAEGGFTVGMVQLANFLADMDWDEAQRWLTRAQELGDVTAESVRKRLTEKRIAQSN